LVRVQITKTKTPWKIPHYRIMSDVDLEVALRKQKSENSSTRSRELLDTEQAGRLKLKSVDIRGKISEHDLGVQLKKIRGWLEGGKFVKVNIKAGGDKVHAAEMEAKVLKHFSEEPELLGKSNAKLRFKLI
jgi:translation initiation factor IF-3